ncbi:HAD-IC family P-type ATPase [Ferrimonas sp. YFM]|uniref:cation-translocating P-type ATPase n=1 Tax=Ferrimonas sp. YFM TaxID=3028878 RepID=UPI0025726338|nr:HAD-IC family P-type ATPase [Ferrimonas sp. YFM]BDY03808.1 haloacid dehalogenase [Ferrimonas sp. YFM]
MNVNRVREGRCPPGLEPGSPWAEQSQGLLDRFGSSPSGLSAEEAGQRLKLFGPNRLPKPPTLGVFEIFLRQFRSPLIYILMLAAVLSLVTHEVTDALFIGAILLINAIIGTIQEFSAQRATEALQRVVGTRARVLRDGEPYDLDADQLVPGDMVLLESGDKIPADLRLVSCHDTAIDESLLTGESLPVTKCHDTALPVDTPLGDRSNMAFAGTLMGRGRATGVVVATGMATQLGGIAAQVMRDPEAKVPLLVRMDTFVRRVALMVGGAVTLMALVALYRGAGLMEIMLLAVALAVSVIPEGLPVALTVALAIGQGRMAKRQVIVRRLISVEALGSCTCIASDKTGTLTVNRLTVKRVVLPGDKILTVSGEGLEPAGRVEGEDPITDNQQQRLQRLAWAALLCNPAHLLHHNGSWQGQGDAVDVALLVMGKKLGQVKEALLGQCPEVASLPFESERMFCASANRCGDRVQVSVKGAPERILPMCTTMATSAGDVPLEEEELRRVAESLASESFRMLAVAEGTAPSQLHSDGELEHASLKQLTLLGLVGMVDPLRPESAQAVADCKRAGIRVVMVTGDHPITALAVARNLELAERADEIVTGESLRQAGGAQAVDAIVDQGRVFARVEPVQKLDIVHSLQRLGHFVAVSGDGANDSPALKAAQVGVAMGSTGTEVAKETSDLIITDDNFSSILAGVEEGRVAYANVRKVVFLLISTAAAELVLFTLALFTGLPLPLTAVQLLWLNLVTNGIQDIALAFEPAEGSELKRPPRDPKEAIFNRLMLERVILSALTIGPLAFLLFQWQLAQGASLDEARNLTLLMMVLFENVQVFNSRSETLSLFRHPILGNPLLVFGTLAAQLVHLWAMHTPWLAGILQAAPVTLEQWTSLLLAALLLMVVMELHKGWLLWRQR